MLWCFPLIYLTTAITGYKGQFNVFVLDIKSEDIEKTKPLLTPVRENTTCVHNNCLTVIIMRKVLFGHYSPVAKDLKIKKK